MCGYSSRSKLASMVSTVSLEALLVAMTPVIHVSVGVVWRSVEHVYLDFTHFGVGGVGRLSVESSKMAGHACN